MDNQLPLWVAKIDREGGRDHLAIESVGQTMLEDLSSGISNITFRIRYFSFYCFVLQSFFDSNLEKKYINYRAYLKKLSFIYTLSMSQCHINEHRTGIDGIEFAQDHLIEIIEHKYTPEDAVNEYGFKDNNWIYNAKLFNLKLLFLDEKDKSRIPSLVYPYGKKLANLFGNTIKDINFTDINSLNKELLEKLELRWCYHKLSENEEERQLLENILFANETNDPESDVKEINRRYGLILFLIYLRDNHKNDFHSIEKWFYDDISLPEKLAAIKNLWKILIARNYLVLSHESLFQYFLQAIQNNPLTLNDFFQELNQTIQNNRNNDNELISLIANNYENSVSQVLEIIMKTYKLSSESPIYEPSLIIPISQLQNKISEYKDVFFANSLVCLLTLYTRYTKGNYSKIENQFFSYGEDSRISMKSFFNKVNSIMNSSLRYFTENLYKENIIPRHNLVASEKLYSENLNTFHFHIEDGKYFPTSQSASFRPTYNAMKFTQIINFMEDLNLVEAGENNMYYVTNRGENIINKYYE